MACAGKSNKLENAKALGRARNTFLAKNLNSVFLGVVLVEKLHGIVRQLHALSQKIPVAKGMLLKGKVMGQ